MLVVSTIVCFFMRSNWTMASLCRTTVNQEPLCEFGGGGHNFACCASAIWAMGVSCADSGYSPCIIDGESEEQSVFNIGHKAIAYRLSCEGEQFAGHRRS